MEFPFVGIVENENKVKIVLVVGKSKRNNWIDFYEMFSYSMHFMDYKNKKLLVHSKFVGLDMGLFPLSYHRTTIKPLDNLYKSEDKELIRLVEKDIIRWFFDPNLKSYIREKL